MSVRLLRFEVGGITRIGFLVDSFVRETSASWAKILATWCSGGKPEPLELTGDGWRLSDVTLLAPLADDARGVFCVGMNYADHTAELAAAEFNTKVSKPVIFMKLPESMANPCSPLILNEDVSQEFDWEGELGVVIGKRLNEASPEDVVAGIAGYTIVNDITARDLQRQHNQWFIGKNCEASSPIGPWITPRSALTYPPNVTLCVSVNGDIKQQASTSRMLHSVDDLIALLSRHMTLQPGDIIATGTPSGVGMSRTPPEYLSSGDVVQVSIDGLGVLKNRIR